MKQAIIITIGDELLLGDVIDTNSAWLSRELKALGFSTEFRLTLPDDPTTFQQNIHFIKEHPANLVLFTGGLGPTEDDRSRSLISDYAQVPLVHNPEAACQIRNWFQLANRPFLDINLVQALIPKGAYVLSNLCGSAPGFLLNHKHQTLVALPGVPSEMKQMFQEQVIPHINPQDSFQFFQRELLSFGLGESRQSELLSGLQIPASIHISSLPSISGLRLRVNSFGDHPHSQVERIYSAILERLQPEIHTLVSMDGSSLPQTLVNTLAKANLSLSVAESCTGGRIAHLITSIPGSSKVFKGGFIAYADAVKTDLLHVGSKTLQQFGAVSSQTVCEMALNCNKLTGSDFAIATSGIAGPEGGTPEKPVGLVWMAVAYQQNVESFSLQFRGSRDDIREKASYHLLNQLRLHPKLHNFSLAHLSTID